MPTPPSPPTFVFQSLGDLLYCIRLSSLASHCHHDKKACVRATDTGKKKRAQPEPHSIYSPHTLTTLSLSLPTPPPLHCYLSVSITYITHYSAATYFSSLHKCVWMRSIRVSWVCECVHTRESIWECAWVSQRASERNQQRDTKKDTENWGGG